VINTCDNDESQNVASVPLGSRYFCGHH